MNTVKLAPLLLIFAEVARAKSFTGAAKRLELSKSAVSQQIKRLEDALDMQLLARNTRGVVLTAQGETLFSRSELLAEQLANAVSDVEQAKSQPSGVFKVSVPPFFERNIVVPALHQLSLEFPLLEPELVVTGRWQDLIEHQLDAAIFGGTLKDSNYKSQLVGKVNDVFCASANYIQRHGMPQSLADLIQHKYIASHWQRDNINLVDNTDGSELRFFIAHAARTNNLPTLTEMTVAGMGISLLPEFVASGEIRRGNLVQLLPNYHGRPWRFQFIHRYQQAKPAYVERFYQLVKHYFKIENG